MESLVLLAPTSKMGKTVRIDKDTKWKINRKLSCQIYNIVYLISCEKERCQDIKYVGEAGRSLRTRQADHCGYVRNSHSDKTTGANFNQPGHSLADMKILILEQVNSNDPAHRKEREHHFINIFKSYHKGMNKQG